VGLYFYDKRVASPFPHYPRHLIQKRLSGLVLKTPTIANTDLNTPNKTTTIVGSNLQANANNAVNSDNANNAVNTVNTNNGQINIIFHQLYTG
jgi:hypothetical protein